MKTLFLPEKQGLYAVEKIVENSVENVDKISSNILNNWKTTFKQCFVENSGRTGAGGNIGNSSSISGINDGNSGKCGGSGNWGIFGKSNNFIFAHIAGGWGKLGNLGKSILTVWKLKSGKTISKPKSIFVKSIVILGSLKLGIWIIGKLIALHNKDNLQEYWS